MQLHVVHNLLSDCNNLFPDDVGEGTFPGVGLPSSAASGAMLANTLVPVGDHLKMLEELGL